MFKGLSVDPINLIKWGSNGQLGQLPLPILFSFFSIILRFFFGFGLRAENGLGEEATVMKFRYIAFAD
jgi:hypothetical protein